MTTTLAPADEIADMRRRQADASATLSRIESEWKSDSAEIEAKLQAARQRRDEMTAALNASAAARAEQTARQRWRDLLDEAATPERWDALQSAIAEARRDFEVAAARRNEEQTAFAGDPVHTSIADLEREIQQRRQRIDDARRRETNIIDESRRQRFDAYNAAEDALRVAEIRRLEMERLLKTDESARHVEELHRRFCALLATFDSREIWRCPSYRRENHWDAPPPELQQEIVRQLAAQAERERRMTEEIREAGDAYERAAQAQIEREHALRDHSIHAEIDQLRRQRDETRAAALSPIGD